MDERLFKTWILVVIGSDNVGYSGVRLKRPHNKPLQPKRVARNEVAYGTVKATFFVITDELRTVVVDDPCTHLQNGRNSRLRRWSWGFWTALTPLVALTLETFI